MKRHVRTKGERPNQEECTEHLCIPGRRWQNLYRMRPQCARKHESMLLSLSHASPIYAWRHNDLSKTLFWVRSCENALTDFVRYPPIVRGQVPTCISIRTWEPLHEIMHEMPRVLLCAWIPYCFPVFCTKLELGNTAHANQKTTRAPFCIVQKVGLHWSIFVHTPETKERSPGKQGLTKEPYWCFRRQKYVLAVMYLQRGPRLRKINPPRIERIERIERKDSVVDK
jgi:hypothetical protein